MAEQGKPNELVTLQELAVSNVYEIAALIAILVRKGILTHAEVLDEISAARGSSSWPLTRLAHWRASRLAPLPRGPGR